MQIISLIKQTCLDLWALLFPNNCNACGNALVQGEECICIECQYKLPRTNLHKVPDNVIERAFWGKTKIERATSFTYFAKEGMVQHLVHQLKYKGKTEIGIKLGELFANDIKDSDFINEIEFIVPVPLHPKKMKIRGYNQSEMIAIGMSNVLGIPVNTEVLYRAEFTETQTRKSRYERAINTQNVFAVRNTEQLAGHHVLLIDDVLTTGATIDSCASALKQIKDVKVSVASIAFASN